MLQPGSLPHHLARVTVLAPRKQLSLQRRTHLSVSLQNGPAVSLPAAFGKVNRLFSKAAARDSCLHHRRWGVIAPPSHASYYKPNTRNIRRLLPDADPLPYKERNIVVTTCGELYKKWRAEGRRGYKQAPETGAQVPVVYIHTGLDRVERGDNTERPLTLMLTGAPGNYEDFGKNIPILDKNGVDVLCFNWPGFEFTMKTGYWWHSCDEKTRLAVDFLKELKIDKIDMLVSHSTGSTPAVQIVAEEPSIDVKSLALLMPIATRNFRGSQNPLLFNPAVRWAMKSRRGASIIMPLFQAVMSLSKHPTRGRPYDVFFAYHSCIGYEEHRVERQLAAIRHSKMPALVMVSDNDRLLSKDDNRTLLRRLGCDPELTCLYDKGGHLLRSGSCDDVVKVIELKDGSHYGFSRYPGICNDALLGLLKRSRQC